MALITKIIPMADKEEDILARQAQEARDLASSIIERPLDEPPVVCYEKAVNVGRGCGSSAYDERAQTIGVHINIFCYSTRPDHVVSELVQQYARHTFYKAFFGDIAQTYGTEDENFGLDDLRIRAIGDAFAHAVQDRAMGTNSLEDGVASEYINSCMVMQYHHEIMASDKPIVEALFEAIERLGL